MAGRAVRMGALLGWLVSSWTHWVAAAIVIAVVAAIVWGIVWILYGPWNEPE